jgi:hypothetical protein
MNDLDRLLHDALHDERLALPVPADTLHAVRRRRNRRRTAGAALAGVTAVGLAVGSVALAQGPSGTTPSRLAEAPVAGPHGCATAPAGQLEGSDYVVRTARDWFMTKAQSDAFFHTFSEPSPKPEDTVPSPQASGPGTDRLVAALTAAGVPGAAGLARDEASSGERGALSLEGRLPGGSELHVGQTPRMKSPFTTSGYYGSDTEDSSSDVVIETVPGTGCAALLLAPSARYSYALVQVVTPDGISTGWTSPTLPLAQLKQWAYATARWETTHP